MKPFLQPTITLLVLFTSFMQAQADLTIGLNYAYDPPTTCDNKIKNLVVDICNNNATAASNFEVGIYLYNPANSGKWIVASVNVPSLSGNACRTISNWNIDMNSFCCLPGPGTAYRIGVWADTANTVTESTKNNNASLLSGNIQICANTTSVRTINGATTGFDLLPNPSSNTAQLTFELLREEVISATIYDVSGKIVMNIYEGKASPENRFSTLKPKL